ncbi:hypothetical protein [Kitasatospora sp. NPDC085879]|uniref:hypothetical protein n=1 Tax=Kitasatospora sp. NPDC085879 TaxID=3154769 RepID=UPI003426A0A1
MTDTTAPVPPQPAPAPTDAVPVPDTAPGREAGPESVPEAVPGPDVLAGPEPAPDGRRGRAGLVRWGAAALVLLLSGTGAALAVAAPDRTDIPGLATPGDGRYAFPPLTLPPLPAGKAAPEEPSSYGRHFADLRGLLLPPPKGAVLEQAAGTAPSASAAAPGVPWLPCAAYTADNSAKAGLDAGMAEFACRAATRRTWTAADGTRTDIWLFRFGSRAEASGMLAQLGSSRPKGVPVLGFSDTAVDPALGPASLTVRASDEKANGRPTARAAFLAQGDVAASIVMTNPRGVAEQAYRQVALLQSQMLR